MAANHDLEFSMRQVGGRTLRVARWRANRGTGAKRPLLFFNGIGANIELITPLAERLGGRDVITFDMPGIGESPDPVWPYRLWTMARLADQIVGDFGYQKVDVMGVSWGGGMAQQYALQFGNRVGNLILAATSAGMIMVPGKLSALSKMIDPRRYVDPQFMLKNFRTLYGGNMDEAGAHTSRIKAPSVIGYFHQLFAIAGWTSAPFLPLMRARTLIIMGDDDNVVPLANGHILKALIPNSELAVVENGGHLFLVNQIDQTMEVLDNFLSG